MQLSTLMSMQKVLNLDFKLIEDVRIGLVNQPLTDFTPDFQFGEVEGRSVFKWSTRNRSRSKFYGLLNL